MFIKKIKNDHGHDHLKQKLSETLCVKNIFSSQQ